MNIIFNGQTRECREAISVAELLEDLDLSPRHVAVEVNLNVAPRERHADVVLKDGDRVEVVSLAGGG